MFQVSTYCIQLGESSGVVRVCVRTCNLVISLTACSIMHEQRCWFIMMVPTTLFKPVRSSSHEQSVQHAWTSLWTTMFRLASSTMLKPVNNHVQAGQLNHVQACQTCSGWPAQPCLSLWTTMHVQACQFNHVQVCQQPCSSWLAQPCSSLSTGKNKLCVFTCVVDNMIMKFSSGPDSRSKFRKRTGQNDILHYYCAKINRF